jgi:hypothetical protein
MPTGLPSIDDYFSLVRRDLAEMLGASVQLVVRQQTQPLGWGSPRLIRMRLPGGSHVVEFARSGRVFEGVESGLVRTYASTLDEFAQVPSIFTTTASDDVLTTALVARCVEEADHRRVLEQVLRLVIQQSTKTYEGSRIAVNVCIDFDETRAGDAIVDFMDRPWAAVLGSGISSAILVGGNGAVVELLSLPSAEPATVGAPEPFADLADWTRDHPKRVALAATRTGEVYLFVSGEVAFVRRNSRWRGLPLKMLGGIGWIRGGKLPLATTSCALLALLDASAAHHGACIGIVRTAQRPAALDTLVSGDELWSNTDNPRSTLIQSTSFQSLSRRHRLELLSMDGATVLASDGTILAAGAILRVEAGSSGGGRTAAAKMLGRYGVGIKVSQDGPVTAYSGANGEEIFRMG